MFVYWVNSFIALFYWVSAPFILVPFQDDFPVLVGCWHRQLCRGCFHERKCLCSDYFFADDDRSGCRLFFLKLCFLPLQDSLFCVVAVFGSYYYWRPNIGWQVLRWTSTRHYSLSAFRVHGVLIWSSCVWNCCILRSRQMTWDVQVIYSCWELLRNDTFNQVFLSIRL